MSLVTVINREKNFAASQQLVFHPSETKEFQTLIEKLSSLDSMVTQSECEIERERDRGYQDGYKEGFEQGKTEAREKLSKALLVSQREIAKEHASMKKSAVDLALNIVRKIGLELGDANCISYLANRCAKEMSIDGRVKLAVNPQQLTVVQKKLSSLADSSQGFIIEVIEDQSLEPGACVLVTSHGTVHAGLEEQLGVIQRSLSDTFKGDGDDRAD